MHIRYLGAKEEQGEGGGGGVKPSGTSGTMALGEHCSPRCTCETVQITSNYNFSGKIETAFAGGEDDGSDGVTKVAALL